MDGSPQRGAPAPEPGPQVSRVPGTATRIPCRTACGGARGARRRRRLRGWHSQVRVLRFAPQVGQRPAAVLAAQPPQGHGQEELLADHLAQVEPVVVVVGDHHVAVGQLDSSSSSSASASGAVRQVEEVEVLVERAARRAPGSGRTAGPGRPAGGPGRGRSRRRPCSMSAREPPALAGRSSPRPPGGPARVEGDVDVLPLGRDLET